MSPDLMRLRPWFEPFAAVAFVALWINAEVGRLHTLGDLVILLAFGLAIGLSRVAPFWSLGVVGGVLLLQCLRVVALPESTTWPVYLGVLIVAFVAGQMPGERVRWITLALAIPFAVVIAYIMVVPLPTEGLRWTSWTSAGAIDGSISSAFLTISAVGTGLYVGAWALGLASRLNLLQLQGRFVLQNTARDLAIAETEVLNGRERDWIAQEVHDLLAHSLAVVTAQADGARLSPNADAETKDAALLAISGAARSALIDMQALVEALREAPTGGPQPSLADMRGLLDRLASAGMEVSVQNFGDAKHLTPAKELAVFRILQEGLTNSLRHAGANVPARVTFDWRGPGLALSITTATGEQSDRSDPHNTTFTPGHGIRGMKDRARLAGGWLTAGEVVESDAAFIVAAFFPTDKAAHETSEHDPSSGLSSNGTDDASAASGTATATPSGRPASFHALSITADKPDPAPDSDSGFTPGSTPGSTGPTR
jgi:signal transduction histidine kinase